MVLANWLAVFEARLKLSRFFRRRGARSERVRLRKRYDSFGYAAAMVFEDRQLLSAAVSAVSPNQATTQGTTTVQITGSGFTSVMGVMFGTTAATSFTVNSTSSISAVSPSHSAGQVDIVVDTMSGNSPITSADQFMYTSSPPTVTGVGPTTGSTSGGTPITITGTNFSNVSAVMFGGTYAMGYTVNSTTSITTTAPAHAAGSVDVTVVTSAGTSSINANDHFQYASTGPTVSSVSPGTGTSSGGTSINITGSGFSNVSQVTFGGTSASSFTVNSQTSITAVAPSHTASFTINADGSITAVTPALAAGMADHQRRRQRNRQ